MMNKPWYKVTFLGTMPGTSKVTNWPRKRPAFRVVPGRWVVFDKDVTDGTRPEHALSDHETAEEACRACEAMRRAT